ncbi:MAG TPA: RDD family protein [Acidimicrobiales bacterium]|nr:RDD family protein [Acidimicrobiales bacterium]
MPAGGSTAEIGPRVIAFLIDMVAPSVAVWILSFILTAIKLGILGFLLYLALIAYYWIYLPYTEGSTGQTIGKKMQNIKTISAETGQPVGFGMAFVRYLLNGILCGLGWLFPFFDSQKQTLGDKVSKGITVPA